MQQYHSRNDQQFAATAATFSANSMTFTLRYHLTGHLRCKFHLPALLKQNSMPGHEVGGPKETHLLAVTPLFMKSHFCDTTWPSRPFVAIISTYLMKIFSYKLFSIASLMIFKTPGNGELTVWWRLLLRLRWLTVKRSKRVTNLKPQLAIRNAH